MDYNQLMNLSRVPGDVLTSRLVHLFKEIISLHDNGKGYDTFGWPDITLSRKGDMTLRNVKKVPLTEEVVENNYYRFATLVYCIVRTQWCATSLNSDCDTIPHPVLREIVTAIVRGKTKPLVEKLREPYVDAYTFFRNYNRVSSTERETENNNSNNFHSGSWQRSYSTAYSAQQTKYVKILFFRIPKTIVRAFNKVSAVLACIFFLSFIVIAVVETQKTPESFKGISQETASKPQEVKSLKNKSIPMNTILPISFRLDLDVYRGLHPSHSDKRQKEVSSITEEDMSTELGASPSNFYSEESNRIK